MSPITLPGSDDINGKAGSVEEVELVDGSERLTYGASYLLPPKLDQASA